MASYASREDIPRDRFNRPLVVPPDGGKAVAYTRATTLAGTLEDTYNLSRWQQRQVALGLVTREDLILAVRAVKGNTEKADKDKLNKVCEQAMEAAGSSSKATTGTALHALTELVDAGEPLPDVGESALRDLEAYRVATAGLNVVGMEQFVVADEIKTAGTFDRLVEVDGHHFIADLKTGSIDFGIQKIATQLAIYSRGQLYEHPATRSNLPDVNQKWGLVIHLPAGQGVCDFRWVDLERGWSGALLAIAAREWRKAKVAKPGANVLKRAIAEAPDVDTLSALFRATPEKAWTDEHTEAAKQRKAELQEAA